MEKIKLSNGKEVIIDLEDLVLVSRYRWTDDGHGYAASSIKTDNGKWTCIKMHRLITNCPKGKVVDHINGNPLDNRKVNLRICSQKNNTANCRTPSTNTSGYKGVSFFKRDRNYRAYIKTGQNQFHLGYFLTAEDAAYAYNKAAVELFGEFARLNTLPENFVFGGAIVSDRTGVTGYIGVSKANNGYKARINSRYLGYFSNIKDAASAYNKAALKLFGEDAILNKLTDDLL